jgi:hypothetical protein
MRQLYLANSVLLITTPGFAADLTPAQIFRMASPSIVVVETYDDAGNQVAQGSGVAVPHQQVVTNCHVFEDATTAKVVYSMRSFEASLLFSDVERDLCTLQVPGLAAPSAKFGNTATLEVGDKAYAIGAPKGFTLTLTDGLISSVRPVAGGNLLQTSAAISPGSSGGGLFNSRAELLGITTLYFKDSPQLNFAVPVEWIFELPERSKMHNVASATASDVEIAEGKAALTSLGKTLHALDPLGYERRLPELELTVTKIATSLPPSQWEEATRNAYLSILERENAERTAADDAAADGDAAAADAAQAAANEAASAAGAAAIQSKSNDPTASRYVSFEITGVRTGRANARGELVENSIFSTRDTIHAEVDTIGSQRRLVRARWTYGDDDQLVWEESATVPAGSAKTYFQVRKPDGWPIGAYQVTISSEGQDEVTRRYCIEDAASRCSEVRRQIYSYVERGQRAYSSSPPPPQAQDVRTIQYKYFEISRR